MTNTLGKTLETPVALDATLSKVNTTDAANANAAAANAVAGVNAAAANAATASAAAANAATSKAGNVNAGNSDSAAANAAAANAAAVNAATANAATANAATANAAAANAATANAAANTAGSTATVNPNSAAAINNAAVGLAAKAGAAAGAQAALATPQKSASNDFAGAPEAASSIGSTGGIMNQGSNVAKGGGPAKSKAASKDKISDNDENGSYPDIKDTESDKRNMTNSEESFDNDTIKKVEPKSEKVYKESKNAQTDESSGDENSGFDASTSSTANLEENGAISFDTTSNDDFKMDEREQKQESTLDGKAQMQFNQTNDEDDNGAGSGKATTDSSVEEPTPEADDKTASLQVGSVKDSKVQDFAATTTEKDDSFVSESDIHEKEPSNEVPKYEDESKNVMSSGISESEVSRAGSKKSQWRKAVQKSESIQSDEALRGNESKLKRKHQLKLKHKKGLTSRKTLLKKLKPLQKKPKFGKQYPTGNRRVHTKAMMSQVGHQARMKGHSVSRASKLIDTNAKLNNSTEFFIGNRAGKNAYIKATGKSSEFKLPSILKETVKAVSPKHQNSSEFFIIKTNNMTTAEPRSEESLYTTNSSKDEFITGAKKNIVDDLADFQLSDSAKKHLLPGDLEKLAKLHQMLSLAQINLLRKEETQEVKGIVRMLKPKETDKRKYSNDVKIGESGIKGKYRSAINAALKQIEGVRKSLIKQEDEQDKGKQPNNERYRAAIHEALKEVDAVKKSLMQTSSSSTKLLTNAIAISNLANLLQESTNIFNKAYGTISKNYPTVAANMVTGDLISPGTSGVLINPAAATSSQQSQQFPDAARKSAKDVYAEIGSPALVEEQNSDKKSSKVHVIDTHSTGEHPELRTIKETKRQLIRKN